MRATRCRGRQKTWRAPGARGSRADPPSAVIRLVRLSFRGPTIAVSSHPLYPAKLSFQLGLQPTSLLAFAGIDQSTLAQSKTNRAILVIEQVRQREVTRAWPFQLRSASTVFRTQVRPIALSTQRPIYRACRLPRRPDRSSGRRVCCCCPMRGSRWPCRTIGYSADSLNRRHCRAQSPDPRSRPQ